MFHFIENLWEFMGYWTGSYYGQWISLSNWKLGVWTQNLRLECSQCLTTHAKRLDLTRWIRSTEKPLLEKSVKLDLDNDFRKESNCPKSLSRRFSAEICSKRKFLPWYLILKCFAETFFLWNESDFGKLKTLIGLKFPQPELIRLPWMSKPWF